MAKNETKQHIRTLDIDKKIIDSIDNGIIILDDELHIHHYNKWLELHTNIKECEILNKKLDEVFENIKHKTLTRKIKTALKMDSPTFYSANISKYLIPIKIKQIKNSNFSYMQQDVSIIPLDKKQNLITLIITDQTNMIQTNTLLHSHIEKIDDLNSILTKEHDMINEKILFIKFDKLGVIYDVSQALLNLLKYKKNELINKNFFIYKKNSFSKEVEAEIILHMKDKKSYTFEEKVYDSHSKELWIKSSLVPEYNSKDEHLGFILFRENITDAKALERSNEKILSTSRSAAMGEMISMIAHQWRQPLSLINTIIATIKIKKEMDLLDNKTVDEYLEKVETTIKYLSETIDDFGEYFKPSKEVSQLNILALFNKSLFFLKGEISQLNINYELHIDKTLSIRTYKDELLQGVLNIIKNSIDAFSDEQENKKINVQAKEEKEYIQISIEDNAGGIPDDIIDKIYEPYFSTKSKNKAGLGLYMCQTIITEHLHGKLTITSEGSKTKVIIKLPHTIK